MKGLNLFIELELDNLEGCFLYSVQLRMRVNKDIIRYIGKIEFIIFMFLVKIIIEGFILIRKMNFGILWDNCL